MGLVQKDAFRTMLISYAGIVLGYLNKGILFIIVFSAEQIGLINLIFSIGTLFSSFANFGITYTIWKFFPFVKHKENKHHGFLAYLFWLTTLFIIFCLIVLLLFQDQIIGKYEAKSPLFVSYFWWTVPIGISYVYFMIFDMYLRSLYKNIFAVFVNDIVSRIFMTVLITLYFFKIISFDQFIASYVSTFILSTLLLIGYLIYLNEFNINFKSIRLPKKLRRIIFQFSIWNYVNTLGSVFVLAIDVMMIAQMLGLKETGVYTTILLLISALQVPYKSIIRVTTPMVSDLWKTNDMVKMKQLYHDVSAVSLTISLIFFIPIWQNVEFIFSIKPEYQQGIFVFLFLMIGRLVDMYFGINGAIFITSKKYKFDLLFTLLLIFIVYFLNLILIPMYGIKGAAISTAIAFVLYNIGRLTFVWVAFKIHPFHKNQFYIILLATMVIMLSELFVKQMSNEMLKIFLNLLLFIVGFILPIYFFNLEMQIKNYLIKGLKFVKNKLS